MDNKCNDKLILIIIFPVSYKSHHSPVQQPLDYIVSFIYLHIRHEDPVIVCQHLVAVYSLMSTVHDVLDSLGRSVDKHLDNITLLEPTSLLNFLRPLETTSPVVTHCVS